LIENGYIYNPETNTEHKVSSYWINKLYSILQREERTQKDRQRTTHMLSGNVRFWIERTRGVEVYQMPPFNHRTTLNRRTLTPADAKRIMDAQIQRFEQQETKRTGYRVFREVLSPNVSVLSGKRTSVLNVGLRYGGAADYYLLGESKVWNTTQDRCVSCCLSTNPTSRG
jgi:hypothetical protein